MKNKFIPGYYVPSPSFRQIHEHFAIMEADTLALIAVVGSTEDTPENIIKTRATINLFSKSPELRDACRALLDMITDGRLHGPEIAQAIKALEGL